MDITNTEKAEESHYLYCFDSLDDIRYLYSYDPITGLHNRRCFEDKIGMIDIKKNLPLSVISADIYGLKMTNDILGYPAGDKQIKNIARILVRSCRKADIIARVGDDVFIILLPKTTKQMRRKYYHILG